MRDRWGFWASWAVVGLLALGLTGWAAAETPRGSPSVVLAIYQTSHITVHDNFTVSLRVGDTSGITFMYFTFCQLTSSKCYSPVIMSPQGSNWYVGTTKPMTSYSGMIDGVRAGYNITIVYSDNHNVTEPTVPNPFANLTIATSVTGEFMFQMTVSPLVFGLHGIVADSTTGRALVGAHVALTPGTNTTTTDAAGSYSFAGLVNGTYTLSVSFHGYRSTNATVAISGHDATQNVAVANSTVPIHPGGSKSPWGAWGSPLPYLGVSPLVLLPVLVGILAVGAFAVFRARKGASVRPGSDSSSPRESAPPPSQ
ncbi:MAG: carboxypeptidase-like regulatory domain-containing protein [Thermoplasmata archaeon]|nr:carboxypeptidase-like regulatory domain-containing protein [Thermoplasmata archaeon]